MQAPEKRHYILIILLITAILSGGVYTWWQTSSAPASIPAAAPVSLEGTRQKDPEVVVYVSGFVVRPGVYSVPNEARAIDAVNAAGGFSTGADATKINLAQKLADGMQVNVPGSLTAAPVGTAIASGKVSLNNADKKQLETLPGIGPSLADRILEYRQAKGSFQTLDELKKVSGIGEAKYNALKDKIAL